MRGWVALALLLAGCGQQNAPERQVSAGERLEAVARARGLVVDPATATPIGAWARASDRLCIVPGDGGDRGSGDGAMRIGAVVDYGAGQGCAASGTVARDGDALSVAFGDCRFDARFDGTGIMFPASVPASCDRLCRGRASLSALAVERVSGSVAEARTLRAPNGRSLCAD